MLHSLIQPAASRYGLVSARRATLESVLLRRTRNREVRLESADTSRLAATHSLPKPP
jgi:hypothetical protein